MFCWIPVYHTYYLYLHVFQFAEKVYQWFSPTIFSTIGGACVLSVIHSERHRNTSRFTLSLRHFVSIVNNTMPQYCCVPGWNNFGGHRFPNEKKLNKKWRVAIKRVDPATKQLWTPGKHDVMCSGHFKDDDFRETLLD